MGDHAKPSTKATAAVPSGSQPTALLATWCFCFVNWAAAAAAAAALNSHPLGVLGCPVLVNNRFIITLLLTGLFDWMPVKKAFLMSVI